MLRRSATCAICAGDSFEYLDTYKHRWAFCLDCGNAERERKERYPMECQPLKLALQIAMRLMRAAGRTYDLSPLLLHDRDVIADERSCYLYEQECRLTYETTKWKGYDDVLLKHLQELDVTLGAKKVLSVSDGPGFFARRVKDHVAEIVTTEFSDRAVAAMRSVLGIEALTYDLNNDSLADVVQGRRFDVVLLRSCVAFCTDLPALSSEIAKVITPAGLLVVGVHPPSLGASLQWMFGEYIPAFWFQPETVVRHMTSRGFGLLAPYTRFKTVTDPKKRYPMTWKERVMFRPFWWFYYLKSLVRSRAFPPALDECAYDMFFRWRGPV